MSRTAILRSPRRRVTRIVLAGALALILVLAGVSVGVYAQAKHDTTGTVAFDQPLPIPPLATSRVVDGTRVFTLELRRGQADFGHGLAAESFFGQDAAAGAPTNAEQYLAPTIRAARGEKVRVDVVNHLGTTTSLHWHGMHLPAAMDGGPHQPIADGSTWSPTWPIRQPAASLWYHPHPHGSTEAHVSKGLAGMFLLDDPGMQGVEAQLPHTYGVDDVPVVLQGKAFDDGAPVTQHTFLLSNVGTLGEQVLANGKVGATFEATTRLVRLRLLNASTARTMRLGFSDNRSMQLIAGDGGLLSAPVDVHRLTLSPGDRAEVLVPVQPRDTASLRSYPVHLAGWPSQRFAGGDDTLDVMQLRGARTLNGSAAVPTTLATLPAPDESTAVAERTFDLERPTINGKTMDMSRIDFAVTGGTSETWTIRNTDFMPHNFHVHDVQFEVLSVDGRTPPPEMRGRQDTVLLPAGERVRLLIHFDADHTDPTTPYMFHCHLLWHEDQGMMGQFVVVAPGQRADPEGMTKAPGMTHGHHAP